VRVSSWVSAAVAGCLLLPSLSAYGCEFIVREVGFIDAGIEPYRLIVYLPEDAPADVPAELQEAMELALDRTNIRFEPVAAGADPNHPALKLAKEHGISRFPAVVLLSPDGQSMPLALSEQEPSLAKAVVAALEKMLVSPVRRQILDEVADTYGAVLLIEGPEAAANAAAREAVSAAIGSIKEQLEYFPKPIKNPPEMVVLDQKSLAAEQVLLWTLRLKPEDVNRPYAAVFYGRGRWIGPLFEGEILTTDNLIQLLAIIGADCECGLDYRWVQGTMLPSRWDEALQQKVTANLGFDPENPMVKMEMISIVRRGMGGFDYPGIPMDYREIEVGDDVEGFPPQDIEIETPDAERETLESPAAQMAPVATVARAEVPRLPPAAASPHPSAVPGPNDTALRGESRPSAEPVGGDLHPSLVGQVLAASLGGMVLLVGVASLVIVFRARRP
jgi:hypothetical protein